MRAGRSSTSSKAHPETGPLGQHQILAGKWLPSLRIARLRIEQMSERQARPVRRAEHSVKRDQGFRRMVVKRLGARFLHEMSNPARAQPVALQSQES